MSIHFISGKPGGGKSLLAVRLIVDELISGSRPIYTNVALRLGELNEYLQREYPAKDINLFERVRILSDDETKRFWTVRPNGAEVPLLTKQDWEQGRRPEYKNITDQGIMYVIDEVHNFFNARAWMETGRDVLYYLSQHRKLGDTVLCITQAVGNVDKQFRSVTQDYTYIRNLSKEKMGFFKLPNVFITKTFGSPPTETSQAMETGTFRLDVEGLAKCYDTAKGVGLTGKLADQAEKKKGLPIWVLVVGVSTLIMLVAFFGPRIIAKVFSVPKAKAAETRPVKQEQPPETKMLPHGNKKETKQEQKAIQETTENKPEVTVDAVERLRNGWTVYLSNGEEINQNENRITEITKGYVKIDGQKYKHTKLKTGDYKYGQFEYANAQSGRANNVEKNPVEVTVIGRRESTDAEVRQWQNQPQWSQSITPLR